MISQDCQHADFQRFGRDRHGNQRFRCKDCRKTFSETRPRPIGRMTIPMDRAELILRLLLEGNSVRSVERICRTDKKTILALLVEVGARCERLLSERVQGVLVDTVEVDELWSPVLCRERTRELRGYDETVGDIYTYIATERSTKLILSHSTGRRDYENTEQFIRKLWDAIGGQCRIDSDGWTSYRTTIGNIFSRRATHGICVKIYGRSEVEVDRYERARVTAVKREGGWNPPLNVEASSTSICERLNLQIRTGIKRFARLTLSYSKKLENHRHAVSLYAAYFNYVRRHSSIKTTPAVATGLEPEPWSLRRLLEESAEIF